MNGLGVHLTLPQHLFAPLGTKGGGEPPPSDPAAVAWRLDFNALYHHEEPAYTAGYFARFLESVDTTRVRELVVGCWGDPSEDSPEELVELLTGAADRFPALRAIALSDVGFEESELSWMAQCDVTPLLRAFPRLEVLETRGAVSALNDDAALTLHPVRHESLRVLRMESGGLPGAVVRAVGECDLPALEHLELWLGAEHYGCDATVADLAGILAGRGLPALRHLGPQDSEFQDEIAAAVASAPVVARLESLSLSMGILTDEGAEALLSGQPLTHLKRLDLHHHYLTEPMQARLREALPGVDLDLSEPQDPDDEWRSVSVAE